MYRRTLAVSALHRGSHMAATPAENNRVRTKTVIPVFSTWGIARPFPRSHVKCRIPFNMWYMTGKASTNLAEWISAGPRHRDFTNAK